MTDLAVPPRARSQLRHRTQVARARRFLNAHATEAVRLRAVAREAGASAYHFSRIYRAVTGETVVDAVARIRIERAAAWLCHEPCRPVTDIALGVGYQTPSAFNKAFRAALQVSPSQFRAAPADERYRRLTALRATAELAPPSPLAVSPPVLRHRGDERVIYVREHGSYTDIAAPLAWARLEAALPSAWFDRFERIAAIYDDPCTVPTEAQRYDAGVVVASDTPVPPGARAAIWPGGAYAVFEYRGPYHFIGAAFAAAFTRWLVRERPRLRPVPYLERYRNSSVVTPPDELITELWLPMQGES